MAPTPALNYDCVETVGKYLSGRNLFNWHAAHGNQLPVTDQMQFWLEHDNYPSQCEFEEYRRFNAALATRIGMLGFYRPLFHDDGTLVSVIDAITQFPTATCVSATTALLRILSEAPHDPTVGALMRVWGKAFVMEHPELVDDLRIHFSQSQMMMWMLYRSTSTWCAPSYAAVLKSLTDKLLLRPQERLLHLRSHVDTVQQYRVHNLGLCYSDTRDRSGVSVCELITQRIDERPDCLLDLWLDEYLDTQTIPFCNGDCEASRPRNELFKSRKIDWLAEKGQMGVSRLEHLFLNPGMCPSSTTHVPLLINTD